MTRPSCLFLLSILAIACLLPIRPVEAQAEIRRCVTDSGATIYTDRNCADVGAAERLPRLTADAGGAHTQLPSRGSCVRRVQDLVHELTSAIDRGDVNQLASLYHWPGIGTRNGYAIMDRLDAIVQRPLVDIRPLFPVERSEQALAPVPAGNTTPVAGTTRNPLAPPTAAELLRRSSPWRPSVAQAAATPTPTGTETAAATASTAVAHAAGSTTAAPPVASRRRSAPYALQIEQTLVNTATPSRTVFGLRRHLGCWWVSL